MKKPEKQIYPACPIPKSEYPYITMAHGSGGRMTHQLIDKIFIPAFGSEVSPLDHDGAVLDSPPEKLVVTTDSFVVDPLFFPGGDIGTLAVNGTVNDLAMCGARPLYMSVGFILEEGLAIETLWQITLSMRSAAKKAGIQIVTGDTKVVDRGKGDGVYINTTGVGEVGGDLQIDPSKIKPGDRVIINGDIGRHGIAVLSTREGLSFDTEIESDCAPLSGTVLKLLHSGVEIHCLRDLTRGGLATALVELAASAGVKIEIDEDSIPVINEVNAACEILGFDPAYIANEGRFVAFIPERFVDRAVEVISSTADVAKPSVIGRVSDSDPGLVTFKNSFGAERIIDMLSGDQFPRIC
jgi:hydrogenase expression/formation protein HypE